MIKGRSNFFNCFALDSKVEDWLTRTFVPDLTKIGLKPVYGPFGLSHNMDLNSFQSRGRTTDLALVVCTPRLHARCTQDVGSITGCAQEVRIIQERYNDPDKQGTLFTMLLHGKRRDCIPKPILEPIFAAKLEMLGSEREEDLYDYYSKGLRLMTSLAGLESQVADELKSELYVTLSDMIFGNTMDTQKIQAWRQERYPRKYNLLNRQVCKSASEEALAYEWKSQDSSFLPKRRPGSEERYFRQYRSAKR